MTLPATGQISMSNINTEMGRAAAYSFSLNDADVRALAGIPAGAISLNDFHGKSYIHYARPSNYVITSVLGGSVTNPSNVYAGKSGALSSGNAATYALVQHGPNGTPDTREILTLSGFGTGVVNGTVYAVFAGNAYDSAVGTTSEVAWGMNGSDSGSITSFGAGSVNYTVGSPLALYTGNLTLDSFTVFFSTTGGRVGPIGDGDNANSDCTVYDVVIVY